MTLTIRLALPLLFLVLACPPIAEAEDISWVRYHHDSCTPARGEVIECGDLGSFLLDRDPLQSPGAFPHAEKGCAPVDGGVGTPRRYPVKNRRDGLSAAPYDGPCSDGSCLTALDRVAPDEPWIAVVDWNHWHGWSVSATILQAAAEAIPVVLFPLDGDGGHGDSDVEVLRELCRIAESVDDLGLEPPLVVNLSFGRLPGGSSLTHGLDAVLNHIATRTDDAGRSPMLIAAAGNHQELLYPASHSAVYATASIDLQAYGWAEGWVPSWESPPETAEGLSVFPSSGICLNLPNGGGWIAPPGSSYSAAYFTGTVAPLIIDDPGLPASLGGEGQTAASLGVLPEGLIESVVGPAVANCGTFDPPDAALYLSLGLGPASAGSAPSTPTSLAVKVQQSEGFHPTPEPDPCVPCVAHELTQGNGGGGNRWAKAHRTAGRTAPAEAIDAATVINLSKASLSLDDLDFELVALELRVVDDYYPLLASPEDLAAIASGQVGALRIPGLFQLEGFFESQASLIFVLRDPLDPDAAPFWSASPLLTPTAALLNGG
ncbi:MAG: hypothetical protein AAGM22_07215 [Acidobacteriota bacterium]